MRHIILSLFILISCPLVMPAQEERKIRQVSIEVEPIAYILKGAGIHGRYQHGDWRYSLEIFGLEIPESLHGNDGFDASVLGAELHFERFLSDPPDGFYIGPEIAVSNLKVTHQASQISEEHLQYSAGLRFGYLWYTGLGNLYLSPVGGISFSFNSKDFEISGEEYESGSITPFATVGIGWSF